MNAGDELRILGPDGALVGGAEAPLDGQQALAAYRLMTLARAVDERAFSLQRQGRLGTFSPATGQEASVVGSAWALDSSRDWIVPQYRELAAMVHHGYPLERFFLYFMGNPVGAGIPGGVRSLPFQIAIGAQVPHAVGLGWGIAHRGSGGVVLTYFGDGGSSEGDVHEACNFAGVLQAPVVFLLQNNGWAISTPVARQTAAATFASRAVGYGFPGELVDGCDLFAVFDATRRAVARARAGHGPTLIESRCWRLGPHNTSDDPERYVRPEELDAHRALDPLIRVRRYLERLGLMDEARQLDLEESVREQVAAAVTAAQTQDPANPAQLFEHVYACPPERLRRQRAAATGATGVELWPS